MLRSSAKKGGVLAGVGSAFGFKHNSTSQILLRPLPQPHWGSRMANKKENRGITSATTVWCINGRPINFNSNRLYKLEMQRQHIH